MEMTICAKCKHLRRKESIGSPRYNVWYNLICAKAPREVAIDPVSGEVGYSAANDLGMKYISEDPFYYCRDINKYGSCSMWEKGEAIELCNKHGGFFDE